MSRPEIPLPFPPGAPPALRDDVGDVHFVPAPCQVACPVGTDAPSYIGFIWEGKYAEAFEAITATNPFSSICGRVCDAPCEPACRRAESDGPIAIRNLKRFVMDQLGRDYHLPPVAVTRKETIGVVGAGPAGLTAAQNLAEAGFAVHVYEMSDRPGGMMVWGIPAFRLPPGIIEEDMRRMFGHCPGIELHLNCALGRDITLEELKRRHDAVLITIGAWWGKPMAVPGEDVPGVVDGVGFLRRVNAGERPGLPHKVVVVGGGDVAMDACRAAKRLPGCERVIVVYRRGPEDIPARRDELDGAIKEGIEFVYNTQQVSVVRKDGELRLRCVRTEPGPSDADGRRRPLIQPGSEHDIACGMVIAAVGQKAESAELDRHGLMLGERVAADFATMTTGDPKVFAAGDGAFGGSTIVVAMYHGHRAAYCIKAYLDGVSDPMPYRTPYRTRRVVVAQDPRWETAPRQHQAFHGLGAEPAAFGEIESTYDAETAKLEAARCYRCDAENGTADYGVANREDIFAMARTAPRDASRHRAMLQKRLAPRPDPFPAERPATLDDLVFLPANLSRLVIDPYREACATGTVLGAGIEMHHPLLVAGFDEAPEEVRLALSRGMAKSGCGYIGRRAIGGEVPWLQLLEPGEEVARDATAALLRLQGEGIHETAIERCRPGQLLGLVVKRTALEEAVPLALDRGYDLLVLDGSAGMGEPRNEMGPPDLGVIREAIRVLRRHNREEELALLYYGGVRSGTDAAKLLALGCQAAVLGVAMAFALGAEAGNGEGFHYTADPGVDERAEAAQGFLDACGSEASMMARCTGKTNIHNLEPEDLRSITLATAAATAVRLAGTR